MEGFYSTKPQYGNFIENLKERKERELICSLSKYCNSVQMWAFYADGGKGCCIDISPIKKETKNLRTIKYKNSLPEIENPANIQNIRCLLTHKSTLWKWEHECRLFKTSNSTEDNSYIECIVHGIIFGYNMTSKEIRDFKQDITNTKIYTRQITKNDLYYGFENIGKELLTQLT